MTDGSAPADAPITVVVPVYRGHDDVRRCLESVVRHAGTSDVSFDLLVVDDATPEPELGAYLDSLPPEQPCGRLTLLRSEQNLGFVKTCNRALEATPGDVVLLNSDTVVTAGWLDRLAAAARRGDVATVTPLTNFGSICSIPTAVTEAFALAGPMPLVDECADFVRQQSIARLPEVITGVGFCMYITRAAISTCGLFDEETFGTGYGEEVDFCLRASGLGFRHLVEDATFVYHRGAGSFGARRQEGLARSSELLHRRYPFFRAKNLQERADDPLTAPFAALELGLAERRSARPHVLQVLHSRPGELGGTEKHLGQLLDGLLDEFDCSVFQPFESGYLLSTVWRTDAGAPTRHEFLIPGSTARPYDIDDPGAAAALTTVLDMFDFDAVHIQNIVHHSLAPLAVLSDFDGPVVCSVRDMYLACPHHWLLYRNKDSCGIPDDLSFCARCLPETRNLDVDYLQRFRDTVASRLDTVDHWVFATQSAVDFLLRVYDIDPDRVEIIEHGAIIDHERTVRVVDPVSIFEEPLRIAYVGIGWAKKGLPVVNRLAETFAGTSVEFHHFGELREPISSHIHLHGRYDNNVLPELLKRAGIQVVLLPGPFIETFGHVLTEALIAGLPVIGDQHGALGERIRRHDVGWTIDPEDLEGIRALIDNLDRCRREVLRATRHAAEVPLRPVDATVGRYAALYRTNGAPVTPGPRAGGRPAVDERERLQRELRAMGTVNRQLHAQLADAKRSGRDAPKARKAETKPDPSAGAGRWQRRRAAAETLARRGVRKAKVTARRVERRLRAKR